MLTTRAPMLAYPGGKARLAPKLVQMMPESGRCYLEPFAGRGNVFWAAALSLNFEQWWLNDTQTAPFFRALRKTRGRIEIPDHNREEYAKCKAAWKKGDTSAIILEPYFTWSGGGYKNASFGGTVTPAGYKKTITCCAEILKVTDAKVSMLDWKHIDWSRFSKRDFVFLDPPYFGADVRAYSNVFDHPGMIKLLTKAKFRWMLTEYEQPFYLKAFGEPVLRKEVQLSCDGINTRRRVECVWTNY